MAKTNSLKLVPYAYRYQYLGGKGEKGNKYLLEYTYGAPGQQKHAGYSDNNPVLWVPNEPFEATLKLERLERGRSAARFWFSDGQGTEYPVFGQGLVEMLQAGVLDHGIIEGTWIAVKRGANYGIERYEP